LLKHESGGLAPLIDDTSSSVIDDTSSSVLLLPTGGGELQQRYCFSQSANHSLSRAALATLLQIWILA
jgi:hypothetical protein